MERNFEISFLLISIDFFNFVLLTGANVFSILIGLLFASDLTSNGDHLSLLCPVINGQRRFIPVVFLFDFDFYSTPNCR